jgi:hypothetical protein
MESRLELEEEGDNYNESEGIGEITSYRISELTIN